MTKTPDAPETEFIHEELKKYLHLLEDKIAVLEHALEHAVGINLGAIREKFTPPVRADGSGTSLPEPDAEVGGDPPEPPAS